MSRTGRPKKTYLEPAGLEPSGNHPRFIPLAAHRPKVSLLKLLQVRRLRALWHRETAE
jgi:hypothetical protein